MTKPPASRSAPAGHDEMRAAREQLSDAIPAIARRIRSLRRQDSDWSMRTSELMSSTVRRVLRSTDGGAQEMTKRSFWGLVETIVRHMLIDHFRRNGVRRMVMQRLRDEAQSGASGAATAADVAESEDAAAQLIRSLSEDERALLQLRMRGLAWRDVAQSLGITEEAARQRWSALRRKARSGAAGIARSGTD